LTETDLDDLAKTKYRLLDNTGILSLELDSAHILNEIERTRPLSVLMAEKIAYLRNWASSRTVTA
jgi:hypothetical protein